MLPVAERMVRTMPELTIGVIHTGNRKALELTLETLLRDHDLAGTELLVIGDRADKKTRKRVKKKFGARYLVNQMEQAPCVMDQLFATASGEFVVCLEGAVRLQPGSVARLLAYYREHPETQDVLHGPLMRGKRLVATHHTPSWRLTSWGTPARDHRGNDIDGDPFVIPMQERGVMSCRRATWPGMPPGWRGLGAEAGYLQERFRRRGGRALCLPGLRWERLERPQSTRPRTPLAERQLRNHFAGAVDLGFDTQYIAHRMRDFVRKGQADQLRLQSLRALQAERPPVSQLVSCFLYVGRLTDALLVQVEESIESFLRQDYREKELVLFNDTPGQTLVCDAPGVRVVNTSARCPSLGEALNAAVAYARGDLLAPWGATSINLPWRLTVSVAQLGTGAVFHPQACWYMLDGELDSRPARPDGGHVSLFTREAFRAVGGYPSTTVRVHLEMDAFLDERFFTGDRERAVEPFPREAWFTILRREQKDAEYLGDAFLDPWQAVGHLPIMRGEIVLRPAWKNDYVSVCRRATESNGPDEMGNPPHARPFVLGSKRRSLEHWFPRVNQRPGETSEEHLARVAALIEASIAAGASHLIVPQAEADWLENHPGVVEYLVGEHWLAAAGAKSGFVFALNDAALFGPREGAGTGDA